MEHIFWKDGDFEARGGIFVRSELRNFFDKLKESGLNPVGIKIDDTLNLEVIVERNQAYIDKYESTNDN
jgi:ABC-type Fe3+-citrate transport system substrate-binding protein